MKKTILITAVTMFLMTIASATHAEMRDMTSGLGLRTGFGLDPDQFVVGVQTIMGTLKGKVDLSPSLDFGTGENVTVIAFNIDGTLNLISPPGASVIFYVGGGPTLALIDPEFGDSDTEIGLTLSGGLKIAAGDKNFYNLKAMLGIGDIPEFKLLFGYMFGLGYRSGN